MTHRQPFAVSLAACVVGMFGTAGVAVASSPTVTVSPALNPGFSTKITDYVTSCSAGTVSVTSNVPAGASLRIDGKTAAKGRTTRKLKLRAGQRFQMISGSGKTALTHSVRCVPADFPAWTTTGTLPKSASFMGISVSKPGSWLIPYAIITDSRGVPLWWKNFPNGSAMDVKVLAGGQIGFWTGDLGDETGGGPFSVYSANGTKLRDIRVSSGSGDAHESLQIANGDVYRIATVRRDHVDLTSLGGSADASVFDQRIEEIDPSGAVVWSWATADHISLAETGRWFDVLKLATVPGTPLDMIHLNSIEQDGDSIIVSARHLDAVYKISKADGSITWKLGGTPTPASLAVSGDSAHDAARFGGQHDARLQQDGTITVYDNGSGYGQRPPRATRWSVNQTAHSASLVEELTDPLITFSYAGGGARRFADGTWLVSWCHQPYIRAYSPTHTVTFSLKFASGGRAYRAAPIAAGKITRTQLVSGMDSQFPR